MHPEITPSYVADLVYDLPHRIAVIHPYHLNDPVLQASEHVQVLSCLDPVLLEPLIEKAQQLAAQGVLVLFDTTISCFTILRGRIDSLMVFNCTHSAVECHPQATAYWHDAVNHYNAFQDDSAKLRYAAGPRGDLASLLRLAAATRCGGLA